MGRMVFAMPMLFQGLTAAEPPAVVAHPILLILLILSKNSAIYPEATFSLASDC